MAEAITAVKSLELLNVSDEWEAFRKEIENEREEIGNANLECYVSFEPTPEKKYDEKHKAAIQRAALLRVKEKAKEMPERFAEAKDAIAKYADEQIAALEKYVKFHYPSPENFYLEAVYSEMGIKTVGASVLKQIADFPKEVAESLRVQKKEGELPTETKNDDAAVKDDPYEEVEVKE
jgi:hypothetical protein